MDKKTMSRRNFLKALIRGTIFAGMTITGVALAVKKPSGLSGQSCINRSICRSCRVVPDCPLPQALSFRSVTGNRDNGVTP